MTTTTSPSITETLSGLNIGESLTVKGETFTKIGEGGFENAAGVFFSRTEIFCKMTATEPPALATGPWQSDSFGASAEWSHLNAWSLRTSRWLMDSVWKELP